MFRYLINIKKTKNHLIYFTNSKRERESSNIEYLLK
jgi:hypothetical protein